MTGTGLPDSNRVPTSIQIPMRESGLDQPQDIQRRRVFLVRRAVVVNGDALVVLFSGLFHRIQRLDIRTAHNGRHPGVSAYSKTFWISRPCFDVNDSAAH